MSATVLSVPEMRCDACEAAVGRALEALPGVTAVTVDLANKVVRVEHDRDRVPLARLRSAVEDQGYDVAGCEAL